MNYIMVHLKDGFTTLSSIFSDENELFFVEKEERVELFYDSNDTNKFNYKSLENAINQFITKASRKNGKVVFVLSEMSPFFSSKVFQVESTDKKTFLQSFPFKLIEEFNVDVKDYSYFYEKSINSSYYVQIAFRFFLDTISSFKFKNKFSLLGIFHESILFSHVSEDETMCVLFHDHKQLKLSTYFKQTPLSFDTKETIQVDFENPAFKQIFAEDIEEKIQSHLLSLEIYHQLKLDKIYVLNDYLLDLLPDNKNLNYVPAFDDQGMVDKAGERSLATQYVYFLRNIKDFKRYNFFSNSIKKDLKMLFLLTTSIFMLFSTCNIFQVLESNKKIHSLNTSLSESSVALSQIQAKKQEILNQILTEQNKVKSFNESVSELKLLFSSTGEEFVSNWILRLNENSPGGILFSNVVIDKNAKNIELVGKSNSYQSIGAFTILLEDYAVVKINDIKTIKEGEEYEFSLSITEKP